MVALNVVLPGESKRDDSDIALAASHALSWQLFLPKDAIKIVVDIHGADITLSGKVPNWFERALAKKTAWRKPGVHAVIDNMT